MRVSVIIPNYNHEKFLQQRIDSVLQQSFSDFEIIILDDASTDSSRDIIGLYQNHPQVKKILYNSVNSGNTFHQWKKGITEATGEYIWIAESDDFASKKFLETAISTLEKNNGVLFFSGSTIVDDYNKYIAQSLEWTADIKELNWESGFCISGHEFILKALAKKNAILNTSGVVFKKQSFDFRSIVLYKTCGDWLFWINILANTESVITYSPLHLNFFRTHPGTTRNFDSAEKQSRKLMEELSVRYTLYKEGFISRSIFFSNFRYTADLFMKAPKRFTTLTNELELPSFFTRHFFIRRCQLPVLRLLRFAETNVSK